MDTWRKFPLDPALAQWVDHALPHAKACRHDESLQQWLRCGDTWFAGVNALPNDEQGVVDGGPLLTGPALEFLREEFIIEPVLDRAQVSICYPGYPRPMQHESEAAFRFRRDRSAAHIDGILPVGEERRRHLREFHRFVLGIPMVHYDEGASPTVVWEGSHEIVREVLTEFFRIDEPDDWGDIDITDVYRDLRKRIFAECDPVKIVAAPGESYLIHRLALHGISPWREPAKADASGRIICYFRPETPLPREWLEAL